MKELTEYQQEQQEFEKLDFLVRTKEKKNSLREAIQSVPLEDVPTTGVIYLPRYIMAFQFGPKHHYLHDSYSEEGGLFKCRTEEAFFETADKLINSYLEDHNLEKDQAEISFSLYQTRS